jgi:quercetin dioxygenase-like cupin family protein
VGALVLAVAVTAAVLVGLARATPPAAVVTEILAHGTVSPGFKINVNGMKVSSRNPADFTVAHLTFAPTGSTGWHVHPGPVLVTVTSGAVTKYSARDCSSKTYSAGQAFVERGPTDVNLVRNNGTVPAETYVTFISPVGAPPRADAPAPAGCNP